MSPDLCERKITDQAELDLMASEEAAYSFLLPQVTGSSATCLNNAHSHALPMLNLLLFISTTHGYKKGAHSV
jgi:hypothetical protein